MAFANLEIAAGLYDTNEFHTEGAKNVLILIDDAMSVMEKHGLLHSPIEKQR